MSAYRLLLLFFPSDWRREFGDDMTRLFEAQRAAAREAGENPAALWLRAIADAIVHGTAERASRWRSRRQRFSNEVKRWRWWMRAFVQDIRYGLRLLAAQPGVTIIAVVTLALGIGANSAIFAAVDAILLRPLPYADPDRLMMVWEKRAAEGVMNNVVAPADYLDWTRLNTVFESMAG